MTYFLGKTVYEGVVFVGMDDTDDIVRDIGIEFVCKADRVRGRNEEVA